MRPPPRSKVAPLSAGLGQRTTLTISWSPIPVASVAAFQHGGLPPGRCVSAYGVRYLSHRPLARRTAGGYTPVYAVASDL